MQNFDYYNPTRIVFGKDTIARLAEVLPHGAKILMAYGGGSIKRNGVYDQVIAALKDFEVVEFGGIEPNPEYATLMRAAAIVREQNIDFILAVGGGSVLDGVKFIAGAARWTDGDPWRFVKESLPLEDAVPLGSVLTLPATGSETNCFSVVSRRETKEKLAFASPKVFPAFSILDPQTTCSLPENQTRNGIVDSFVHVMEQYATADVNAPLQDRQCEAIIETLMLEGPKVLKNPDDYDARANIMWSATNALSGLIGCGAPQDWSTHMIGHEITALWDVDHAQTLAIVLPAMLREQRGPKGAKLKRMAEAVWGVTEGDDEAKIDAAIDRTEEWLRSVGMATRLAELDITDGIEQVADRIAERGEMLGENGDIDRDKILAVLERCRA